MREVLTTCPLVRRLRCTKRLKTANRDQNRPFPYVLKCSGRFNAVCCLVNYCLLVITWLLFYLELCNSSNTCAILLHTQKCVYKWAPALNKTQKPNYFTQKWNVRSIPNICVYCSFIFYKHVCKLLLYHVSVSTHFCMFRIKMQSWFLACYLRHYSKQTRKKTYIKKTLQCVPAMPPSKTEILFSVTILWRVTFLVMEKIRNWHLHRPQQKM